MILTFILFLIIYSLYILLGPYFIYSYYKNAGVKDNYINYLKLFIKNKEIMGIGFTLSIILSVIFKQII